MNKEDTPTIDELKEELAAIEHERWASWQKWMHEQAYHSTPNGGLVFDGEYIKHLEKQINTPYVDLSATEQASDMEQVDRYWPLIEQYIATSNAQALTKAERAELEMYRRERSIALEDYHEFGKAPVGSPERMAAYVSQLSLHNLKRGAEVLAEWRKDSNAQLIATIKAGMVHADKHSYIPDGDRKNELYDKGFNDSNAAWLSHITKVGENHGDSN